MKTTFIYELIDPKTNQVRYIGKSNNPKERFYQHLSDKKKTHKGNWVRFLLNENLKPILEVIDKVDINEWKFWEQHYISLYKSWGFDLTNNTNGGEGFSDPTGEIRKKISKTLTGRKQFSESIKKRVTTRQKTFLETGLWAKPGTYEKVKSTRLANNSYKHTKKTKIKMSFSAKKAFKEGRRIVQGGVGISRPGNLNPVSREIVQYDLQGNFIREWKCVKQAGKSLGKPTGAGISLSCKGKRLSILNFIWRYKTPNKDEPQNTFESVLKTIKKIKNNKEFIKVNLRRQQKLVKNKGQKKTKLWSTPISQFNRETIIKQWDNLFEIKNIYGERYLSILRTCQGVTKSSQGYFWRFT